MTKTNTIIFTALAIILVPYGVAMAKSEPRQEKIVIVQYKPIDGLDDSKPLPGPSGMMRQILDIMEYDGSIRDFKPIEDQKK